MSDPFSPAVGSLSHHTRRTSSRPSQYQQPADPTHPHAFRIASPAIRNQLKLMCKAAMKVTAGQFRMTADPNSNPVDVDATMQPIMRLIDNALGSVVVPSSCRDKMLDGDLLEKENISLRDSVTEQLRYVVQLEARVLQEADALRRAEEELSALEQSCRETEEQLTEVEQLKESYPILATEPSGDAYVRSFLKYQSAMFSPAPKHSVTIDNNGMHEREVEEE